jgi:hypothetical protein
MHLCFLFAMFGAETGPSAALIEQYVAASKVHTANSAKGWTGEITQAAMTLAAVKRGRIDARQVGTVIANGPRNTQLYTFRSAKDKEAEIARAQKKVEDAKTQVAEIKAGKRLLPANLPYEQLAVGEIGLLVDNRVRVIQVVDERNFLGEVTLSHMVRSSSGLPELEQKFVAQLVWISNVATDTFVDGKLATCPQAFWVCGTKRYDTAGGGTKQVLELRAVNMRPYLVLETAP